MSQNKLDFSGVAATGVKPTHYAPVPGKKRVTSRFDPGFPGEEGGRNFIFSITS